MSQHTAGPWTAHGTIVNKEGEDYEYPIAGMIGQVPDDEAYANARLIAASPDLLEALKVLIHDIEAWEKRTGIVQMGTAVSNAFAAIAKATE